MTKPSPPPVTSPALVAWQLSIARSCARIIFSHCRCFHTYRWPELAPVQKRIVPIGAPHSIVCTLPIAPHSARHGTRFAPASVQKCTWSTPPLQSAYTPRSSPIASAASSVKWQKLTGLSPPTACASITPSNHSPSALRHTAIELSASAPTEQQRVPSRENESPAMPWRWNSGSRHLRDGRRLPHVRRPVAVLAARDEAPVGRDGERGDPSRAR